MRLLSVLAFIFFYILPAPAVADIIRVPADQPTIQAGINAASDGDTVLVADGTYTGDGNRDIDFLGKEITVTSENGPENCIIDCQSTSGDPHRGFHFHSGETIWVCTVSGFTIQGGGVWGTGAEACGGAILCEDASPSIENNIITGNRAGSPGPPSGGGGIACINASPWIMENTISLNVSETNGGGIYCTGESAPYIWDNTIIDNVADDWEQGAGGGIYLFVVPTGVETPSIKRNTIEGNSADMYGGGLYALDSDLYIRECHFEGNQSGMGGGLFLGNCEAAVSLNEFVSNTGWGGGICCSGAAPPLTGNQISGNNGEGILCFSSSPVISHNTIIGNDGRGIHCHESSSPEITANTITGNLGGGVSASGAGSAPVVRDTLIAGNTTSASGGGVNCSSQGSITLQNSTLRENTAQGDGGGICCEEASTVVISGGNLVSSNISGNEGGGIYLRNSPDVDISSCRIIENQASAGGGGILLSGSSGLSLTNVLLIDNQSGEYGGGMKVETGPMAQTDNCTITANTANLGAGIYSQGTVEISDSIVHGNQVEDLRGECTAHHSDIGGGWPGEGNIDVDPLFVQGPFGDFYLSQTAAGQKSDSACVDAGDPVGDMIEGTTRTDLVQDEEISDMGFHYPLDPGFSRLVTGPGPGDDNPPLVRTFLPVQDAEVEHEFWAYGVDDHGINVSTGDVTGDGRDEILTGAGPGEVYGPHVRGFEGDGTPLPDLSYFAYGTLKWGVNVTAGDIDGDGFDEIVTGAGPGAVFGPHVRGWNYDGSGPVTAMPGVSFFAYGTPKWGVNVSAGDIDGDGFDEIVTGAGLGTVYGPHVRGWDYEDTAITPLSTVNFMAYGTNQYGVRVTCGDVDGDYIDEIVTAPGPGAVFGSHIRGWNYDGGTVTALKGLSFLAWEYPTVSYGATVFAGADLDGDGRDDLMVGAGPDPDVGTPVKVYRYDGSQVTLWFSLEGYEGLTHGTTVAAGKF